MPFKVHRRKKKWVVTNESGHVLGEHDSEEAARAQQRAIYANGGGEASCKVEHSWWPSK